MVKNKMRPQGTIFLILYDFANHLDYHCIFVPKHSILWQAIE